MMGDAELKTWPEGVQRVAAVLLASGHPHTPRMLDDAARTAQQAADGLGVLVGQIAKSIIFRRKLDDAAVLVVTSGDQRVDEKKVEALVCVDGRRLGRADAAFVKARTGFSIGGVAPIAHATASLTLIDASLFRFTTIWAAAGHPHAVFQLTPQQLQALTGAPVADFAINDNATNNVNANTNNELQTLQSSIARLTLSAQDVSRQTAANVPSPCNGICRINSLSGLCEGCFRTRDEIAAWSSADDDYKRTIWAAIEQRVAALATVNRS